MVELVYCLLILIFAAGAGLALLRRVGPMCESRAEELAFSLGLGLGIIALIIMLLGVLHLLYVGVFYAVIAFCALLGRKELVGVAGRLQGRLKGVTFNWRSYYFWVFIIVCIGLFLGAIRALQPAVGAVDPLAYHFALPKLYLIKHYLSFERTLTGALYPDNIGMLYMLAIGLRNASLAQVLHWCMGVGTVFSIWCFCRQNFSANVGLWAAAIYAFTPVVFYFSPLGYIDVGLGFFQFLGYWALFNWVRDNDRGSLLVCALFTGLSMGSKHTGIFMGVICAVSIVVIGLWQRRKLTQVMREVTLFSVMALVVVLPWYIRAFIEAGNPIWPVYNHIFSGLAYGGSFINDAPGSEVAVEPLMDRVKHLAYWCAASLWEWSWNNQLGWQKAIGVFYLAFLPGVLVFVRERKVVTLAIFSLLYYLIVVLYIDGNPRYNLVLFALLSVLCGYVAEHMSRWTVMRSLLRTFFIAALIGHLTHMYALSQDALKYVVSNQSPQQFLTSHESNYSAYKFVNQKLPDSSFLLLQGIVKGYYSDRLYMWDHPYQMVLQYRDYETPELLLERFQELGITHVMRMIFIPPSRTQGVGYPQYFMDAYHEEFRKKYLKLIFRDRAYVVFEVVYPNKNI